MTNTEFRFGADYYPEQWPEERWSEDARLMAEAGFNIVRLAEFAWAKMEPVEGKFDFAWLDRAIEILQASNISVILGTPTASPPPWLMTKYPETFRVRDDGVQVTYGNRCEFCPNHPVYQKYARQIVTAMADHYAKHPAVIGWQIDNELGGRCYCPVCHSRFQMWLKKRYGTLDELNQRWGTAFWSHVYNDWKEIPLPVKTGGVPNPGLALDYDRFISDSYVAYQQNQLEILRKKCPQQFITHNFMGFGYDGLNYYDLARDLDLVTWDNYPGGFWLGTALQADKPEIGHDTMRGLKHQNFWVMEQQAGATGWDIIGSAPPPGQLRLWAYQAVAHGADGVVFFRWRTARYGTEQYWHGLLEHDGRTGRRYQEIKRMGAELRQLGEKVQGSTFKSQVAILHSYDSRFGFQIQANSPNFRYGEHFKDVYSALEQHHVQIDIVEPTADLSAYKLVIAPALYVLPDEAAGNLRQFVKGGGTLVVTPRSGVKDEANAIVNAPLPGLLAEVCGTIVEEYAPAILDDHQDLEFTIPGLKAEKAIHARLWCDILSPTNAEVIARYAQGYYAGKPAITLGRFGQGEGIYVGTFGDISLYVPLFGWLLKKLNIHGILTVPDGVEVTERWQGNQRILFILNHLDKPQKISLPGQYASLLDEEKAVRGQIALAPRDLVILLEK